MQNVTIETKGNVATITIDLSKRLGPSSSGKTTVVATTAGNITIPGTEIKLGLNAYTSRG